MTPNGDHQKSTKPPPSPSPLWNSKFFQVWSSMRRFDQPQRYKLFVSRCVEQGGVNIGSVKEVSVKIGLPATTSTGRLELLNEEEHILGIRIVGGDHRLKPIVCHMEEGGECWGASFAWMHWNFRSSRLDKWV